MSRKTFASSSWMFYIAIFIIIMVFYVTTRLLLGLTASQEHTKKDKKWTHKQIEEAKKQGLVKDQPGWTSQQKETARQLGLLNDRKWTPEEHEIAREHGLLNNEGHKWSHDQLQKAKKLNLI